MKAGNEYSSGRHSVCRVLYDFFIFVQQFLRFRLQIVRGML